MKRMFDDARGTTIVVDFKAEEMMVGYRTRRGVAIVDFFNVESDVIWTRQLKNGVQVELPVSQSIINENLERAERILDAYDNDLKEVDYTEEWDNTLYPATKVQVNDFSRMVEIHVLENDEDLKGRYLSFSILNGKTRDVYSWAFDTEHHARYMLRVTQNGKQYPIDEEDSINKGKLAYYYIKKKFEQEGLEFDHKQLITWHEYDCIRFRETQRGLIVGYRKTNKGEKFFAWNYETHEQAAYFISEKRAFKTDAFLGYMNSVIIQDAVTVLGIELHGDIYTGSDKEAEDLESIIAEEKVEYKTTKLSRADMMKAAHKLAKELRDEAIKADCAGTLRYCDWLSEAFKMMKNTPVVEAPKKEVKTEAKAPKWYYALKIKGGETAIYTDWKECSADLPKDKYYSVKKFKTLEEANNFISSVVYYAVAVGREPGLYTNWEIAEAQTKGYPGWSCKSFKSKKDAVAFLKDNGVA